ncbi:hypothetical protein FQA39_LY12159 [Lamprigera yunnana]|nr:hypothetical protein FQA39_LY12159 [Lamprigera yunnana]
MNVIKCLKTIFVLCSLFYFILSKPHQKRHQRSLIMENGYPGYSYAPTLNQGQPPMYLPYQQPYYGMPPPMPQPVPQVYPPYYNNPYYMPYSYYPPMYPAYPMYQPYTYYQPYPYQQPQQPNFYPDPYAHIPTEIVDVDPDPSENSKSKARVESPRHPDNVITRTFDSSKTEPEIKIKSDFVAEVKQDKDSDNRKDDADEKQT